MLPVYSERRPGFRLEVYRHKPDQLSRLWGHAPRYPALSFIGTTTMTGSEFSFARGAAAHTIPKRYNLKTSQAREVQQHPDRWSLRIYPVRPQRVERSLGPWVP
jgi:hypothetical protein